MFYETYTPFDNVHCLAQTLSFSLIVRRVLEYIGSAVVERIVQLNICRNETSRACRQKSDLYGAPCPRVALDYVGIWVESEVRVRRWVGDKPLNQLNCITFIDMRGVTWRSSLNL